MNSETDGKDPIDPQPGEWLVVATLVRPQGRHGELLAELQTDFPEKFEERRLLFLLKPGADPSPIQLDHHWLHQGRIVFKFAGVESIADAESLRGLEVAIPRQQRAPLEDGAVYISDLVGCLLVDRLTHAEIGNVLGVDRESTATDLLIVETPAAGEVLIPFARAFQPKIDLDARRIEMSLPEGLVEINAPGSSRKRTSRG